LVDRRSRDKRGHQRRGQVVYAVVVEVFERAQRDRLAGTRHAADDDEPAHRVIGVIGFLALGHLDFSAKRKLATAKTKSAQTWIFSLGRAVCALTRTYVTTATDDASGAPA